MLACKFRKHEKKEKSRRKKKKKREEDRCYSMKIPT